MASFSLSYVKGPVCNISNSACRARSTTSLLMSQDSIQIDFRCSEMQHYLFKVTKDQLLLRMTLETCLKAHVSQGWWKSVPLLLSVSAGSALCISWVHCAEGLQAGTLEPCGFRGGTSWGQDLWRLGVDDFEQVEKGYVHFYKETVSVYRHISLPRPLWEK